MKVEIKVRRHHNKSGLTSTKNGKRVTEVKAMAKRLNIPYGDKNVHTSTKDS